MNSHNNLELYTFTNFTELNEFEINLVHKERNDLEVRVKMFDDKLIPIQEHLKFLENLKKVSPPSPELSSYINGGGRPSAYNQAIDFKLANEFFFSECNLLFKQGNTKK
jgi:hypothetical protein